MEGESAGPPIEFATVGLTHLGRWAADVRAAATLLTRLPMGAARADDDRTGAAAFPIVGLGIGLLAALPVALLGASEPTLAALLVVAVAAAVTGALHLDGLADTADALLAPDPARAEAARKDPAVGVGGVVALVVVLGADVAAIDSRAREGGAWLAPGAVVIAAVVSRAIPVVMVRMIAPAPAPGSALGFGAWFASRVGRAEAVAAGALAAIIVMVVAGLVGSPLLVVGAGTGGLVGLAVGRWIVSARGGLDGDALGASMELTVVVTLAVVAVLVSG